MESITPTTSEPAFQFLEKFDFLRDRFLGPGRAEQVWREMIRAASKSDSRLCYSHPISTQHVGLQGLELPQRCSSTLRQAALRLDCVIFRSRVSFTCDISIRRKPPGAEA
jgi:hypothetical protein